MKCPSLTVALTGTPNVGKSTLFNILTGLNQHVGNWPGKTIERKAGRVEFKGTTFELIDLPGTYSLSCVSIEEDVARNFLAFGEPGVIVVVINAAQIERGLAFLAEVLQLERPIVIALNMMDVAKTEGISIDAKRLAEVLGLPVVPLVARKNQGVLELLAAISQAPHQALAKPPASSLTETLAKIAEHLPPLCCQMRKEYHPLPMPPNKDSILTRFIARKILEGDQRLAAAALASTHDPKTLSALLLANETLVISLAQERHVWVHDLCVLIGYVTKDTAFRFTNRIDKMATHPMWGLLLFLSILYLLFTAVFTIGTPIQEFLDAVLITPASQAVLALAPAGHFWTGLIANGLISGTGLVLSFVPIMLLFFFFMALLEDIGYMTRAAYVMDRFMHIIGLHGRSFVPMFMGFGCNVPSIMAARVIDDPTSRLLTMMLIPLVPCSARLAVIAFFGAAFFPEHTALFSWSLIALPILVIALVGFGLSHTLFKGQRMPLIMELPLFHLPNAKGILIQTGLHTWTFVKRAGGLITVFSLLIWMLSYAPSGDVGDSPLGTVGKLFNPLAELFGSDWRMIIALITSFIVKENTIATLGILTHVTTETATLTAIRTVLTPQAAIAFMVVQMLFVPCVSTVVMLKKESGSWKWPLLGMALQGFISLLCGVVLFQLLKIFG